MRCPGFERALTSTMGVPKCDRKEGTRRGKIKQRHAEIGIVQLCTKDCWQPRKATKQEWDKFSEPPKENGPDFTLRTPQL